MSDCEEIHKKAFAKWINAEVRGAQCPPVTDLYYDLRDGLLLLTLLERLTGRKLRRERGSLRVHKLSNVTLVLNVLKDNDVKSNVNISNVDIVDGHPKMTLELVWNVIHHWHLQRTMSNPESGLLAWCRRMTSSYENEFDDVRVKDLAECWRDGAAFAALIHRVDPEAFDLKRMLREKRDPIDRLEAVFNLAEEKYGVPRLLDPQDVACSGSDKKAVMIYLMSLYQVLPESVQNFVPDSVNHQDRQSSKSEFNYTSV